MTQDVISLIQELGFPIAIAIGSMGMLAWVMRYILKMIKLNHNLSGLEIKKLV